MEEGQSESFYPSDTEECNLNGSDVGDGQFIISLEDNGSEDDFIDEFDGGMINNTETSCHSLNTHLNTEISPRNVSSGAALYTSQTTVNCGSSNFMSSVTVPPLTPSFSFHIGGNKFKKLSFSNGAMTDGACLKSSLSQNIEDSLTGNNPDYCHYPDGSSSSKIFSETFDSCITENNLETVQLDVSTGGIWSEAVFLSTTEGVNDQNISTRDDTGLGSSKQVHTWLPTLQSSQRKLEPSILNNVDNVKCLGLPLAEQDSRKLSTYTTLHLPSLATPKLAGPFPSTKMPSGTCNAAKETGKDQRYNFYQPTSNTQEAHIEDNNEVLSQTGECTCIMCFKGRGLVNWYPGQKEPKLTNIEKRIINGGSRGKKFGKRQTLNTKSDWDDKIAHEETELSSPFRLRNMIVSRIQSNVTSQSAEHMEESLDAPSTRTYSSLAAPGMQKLLNETSTAQKGSNTQTSTAIAHDKKGRAPELENVSMTKSFVIVPTSRSPPSHGVVLGSSEILSSITPLKTNYSNGLTVTSSKMVYHSHSDAIPSSPSHPQVTPEILYFNSPLDSEQVPVLKSIVSPTTNVCKCLTSPIMSSILSSNKFVRPQNNMSENITFTHADEIASIPPNLESRLDLGIVNHGAILKSSSVPSSSVNTSVMPTVKSLQSVVCSDITGLRSSPVHFNVGNNITSISNSQRSSAWNNNVSITNTTVSDSQCVSVAGLQVSSLAVLVPATFTINTVVQSKMTNSSVGVSSLKQSSPESIVHPITTKVFLHPESAGVIHSNSVKDISSNLHSLSKAGCMDSTNLQKRKLSPVISQVIPVKRIKHARKQTFSIPNANSFTALPTSTAIRFVCISPKSSSDTSSDFAYTSSPQMAKSVVTPKQTDQMNKETDVSYLTSKLVTLNSNEGKTSAEAFSGGSQLPECHAESSKDAHMTYLFKNAKKVDISMPGKVIVELRECATYKSQSSSSHVVSQSGGKMQTVVFKQPVPSSQKTNISPVNVKSLLKSPICTQASSEPPHSKPSILLQIPLCTSTSPAVSSNLLKQLFNNHLSSKKGTSNENTFSSVLKNIPRGSKVLNPVNQTSITAMSTHVTSSSILNQRVRDAPWFSHQAHNHQIHENHTLQVPTAELQVHTSLGPETASPPKEGLPLNYVEDWVQKSRTYAARMNGDSPISSEYNGKGSSCASYPSPGTVNATRPINNPWVNVASKTKNYETSSTADSDRETLILPRSGFQGSVAVPPMAPPKRHEEEISYLGNYLSENSNSMFDPDFVDISDSNVTNPPLLSPCKSELYPSSLLDLTCAKEPRTECLSKVPSKKTAIRRKNLQAKRPSTPSASLISGAEGIKLKIKLPNKAKINKIRSRMKPRGFRISSNKGKTVSKSGERTSIVRDPSTLDLPVVSVANKDSENKNASEEQVETAEEMFQRFEEQAMQEVYKAQLGVGFLSRSLRPAKPSLSFVDKYRYSYGAGGKKKKVDGDKEMPPDAASSDLSQISNKIEKVSEFDSLIAEGENNDERLSGRAKKRLADNESQHNKIKHMKQCLNDYPRMKQDNSIANCKRLYCPNILAAHKVHVKFNIFENQQTGRVFLVPFFNIGGSRTQFDVEDMEYISKAVVMVEKEERMCARHLLYFTKENGKASFLRKELPFQTRALNETCFTKCSYNIEGYSRDSKRQKQPQSVSEQWKIDNQVDIEIDCAEVDNDTAVEFETIQDHKDNLLHETNEHLQNEGKSSVSEFVHSGIEDVLEERTSAGGMKKEEKINSSFDMDRNPMTSNRFVSQTSAAHFQPNILRRKPQKCTLLNPKHNDDVRKFSIEEDSSMTRETGRQLVTSLDASAAEENPVYIEKLQELLHSARVQNNLKENDKADNLGLPIPLSCATEDKSALSMTELEGAEISANNVKMEVIDPNYNDLAFTDVCRPTDVPSSFDNTSVTCEPGPQISQVQVKQELVDSDYDLQSETACQAPVDKMIAQNAFNDGAFKEPNPPTVSINGNSKTNEGEVSQQLEDIPHHITGTCIDAHKPSATDVPEFSPSAKSDIAQSSRGRIMEYAEDVNTKSAETCIYKDVDERDCDRESTDTSPSLLGLPLPSSSLSDSSAVLSSSEIIESDNENLEGTAECMSSTLTHAQLASPNMVAGAGCMDRQHPVQNKISSLVESLKQRLSRETSSLPPWLGPSTLWKEKGKRRKKKRKQKLQGTSMPCPTGNSSEDVTSLSQMTLPQTQTSTLTSSESESNGVVTSTLVSDLPFVPTSSTIIATAKIESPSLLSSIGISTNESTSAPIPGAVSVTSTVDTPFKSNSSFDTSTFIKGNTHNSGPMLLPVVPPKDTMPVSVSKLCLESTPLSKIPESTIKSSVIEQKNTSVESSNSLDTVNKTETFGFGCDHTTLLRDIVKQEPVDSENYGNTLFNPGLSTGAISSDQQNSHSERCSVPLVGTEPMSPGRKSDVFHQVNDEKVIAANSNNMTKTLTISPGRSSPSSDNEIDVGLEDVPETSLSFKPVKPYMAEYPPIHVVGESVGKDFTRCFNFMPSGGINQYSVEKKSEKKKKNKSVRTEVEKKGSVASYLSEKFSAVNSVATPIRGPRLINHPTRAKQQCERDQQSKSSSAPNIPVVSSAGHIEASTFEKPSLSEIFGVSVVKKVDPKSSDVKRRQANNSSSLKRNRRVRGKARPNLKKSRPTQVARKGTTTGPTQMIRKRLTTKEISKPRLTWRQLSKKTREEGTSHDACQTICGKYNSVPQVRPCQVILKRLEDMQLVPGNCYFNEKSGIKLNDKPVEVKQEPCEYVESDAKSSIFKTQNQGSIRKKKRRALKMTRARPGPKPKKDIVDYYASMLQSLQRKAQQLEEETKKREIEEQARKEMEEQAKKEMEEQAKKDVQANQEMEECEKKQMEEHTQEEMGHSAKKKMEKQVQEETGENITCTYESNATTKEEQGLKGEIEETLRDTVVQNSLSDQDMTKNEKEERNEGSLEKTNDTTSGNEGITEDEKNRIQHLQKCKKSGEVSTCSRSVSHSGHEVIQNDESNINKQSEIVNEDCDKLESYNSSEDKQENGNNCAHIIQTKNTVSLVEQGSGLEKYEDLDKAQRHKGRELQASVHATLSTAHANLDMKKTFVSFDKRGGSVSNQVSGSFGEGMESEINKDCTSEKVSESSQVLDVSVKCPVQSFGKKDVVLGSRTETHLDHTMINKNVSDEEEADMSLLDTELEGEDMGVIPQEEVEKLLGLDAGVSQHNLHSLNTTASLDMPKDADPLLETSRLMAGHTVVHQDDIKEAIDAVMTSDLGFSPASSPCHSLVIALDEEEPAVRDFDPASEMFDMFVTGMTQEAPQQLEWKRTDCPTNSEDTGRAPSLQESNKSLDIDDAGSDSELVRAQSLDVSGDTLLTADCPMSAKSHPDSCGRNLQISPSWKRLLGTDALEQLRKDSSIPHVVQEHSTRVSPSKEKQSHINSNNFKFKLKLPSAALSRAVRMSQEMKTVFGEQASDESSTANKKSCIKQENENEEKHENNCEAQTNVSSSLKLKVKLNPGVFTGIQKAKAQFLETNKSMKAKRAGISELLSSASYDSKDVQTAETHKKGSSQTNVTLSKSVGMLSNSGHDEPGHHLNSFELKRKGNHQTKARKNRLQSARRSSRRLRHNPEGVVEESSGDVNCAQDLLDSDMNEIVSQPSSNFTASNDISVLTKMQSFLSGMDLLKENVKSDDNSKVFQKASHEKLQEASETIDVDDKKTVIDIRKLKMKLKPLLNQKSSHFQSPPLGKYIGSLEDSLPTTQGSQASALSKMSLGLSQSTKSKTENHASLPQNHVSLPPNSEDVKSCSISHALVANNTRKTNNEANSDAGKQRLSQSNITGNRADRSEAPKLKGMSMLNTTKLCSILKSFQKKPVSNIAKETSRSTSYQPETSPASHNINVPWNKSQPGRNDADKGAVYVGRLRGSSLRKQPAQTSVTPLGSVVGSHGQEENTIDEEEMKQPIDDKGERSFFDCLSNVTPDVWKE